MPRTTKLALAGSVALTLAVASMSVAGGSLPRPAAGRQTQMQTQCAPVQWQCVSPRPAQSQCAPAQVQYARPSASQTQGVPRPTQGQCIPAQSQFVPRPTQGQCLPPVQWVKPKPRQVWLVRPAWRPVWRTCVRIKIK